MHLKVLSLLLPAIVGPIAGVVAIIFFLVVVFLVILKLRHRDRKPTTEEGGVDQTDEPGGSPPPIARSPVEPNPYLHLGPVTEHLPASSPEGVELKSKYGITQGKVVLLQTCQSTPVLYFTAQYTTL